MEQNFKVYTLNDPRLSGLTARYVGITKKTLPIRFNHHLWEARSGKGTSHKLNWIRDLLSNGLKPEMLLLAEGLTETQAKKMEIHFIKYFNIDLTNGTAGGDGVTMTDEIRRKIGNASRGRKNPTANNGRRKPISQYEKNGTFVKTHESAWVIARELNIVRAHIQLCCKGERPTAGGYKWKYKTLD